MPKNKRTEFKKYSDQFVDFNFVIVKEDKEKQTSKAEVYLEGFKVKEPKGSNIEEILSKFENKMITMMTEFKSEVKSDIVKMEERLKSDMNNMKSDIAKINSRMDKMDSKIEKLDSKVDNFKDEMNDRFDKIESRVSTLENFHKDDFAKKSKHKVSSKLNK